MQGRAGPAGLHELLIELESEARNRALGLECQGKLPRGFAERHYPMTPREQRELRRLKAAAAAATDAATYVALARGEAVPARRLNDSLISYHKKRSNGG